MTQKTLTISGEEVPFKITGFTPLMYKAMYGSDFLKDFMAMEKAYTNGDAPELDTLYKVAYCLAKKADENIPSLEEWLDSFDTFPVADIVNDLMPLIQANFTTTSKKTPVKKGK